MFRKSSTNENSKWTVIILSVVGCLLIVILVCKVFIEPRSKPFMQQEIMVPHIWKGFRPLENKTDPLKLFLDSLTADSIGRQVFDQTMKKMPWEKDSIRYYKLLNDNF